MRKIFKHKQLPIFHTSISINKICNENVKQVGNHETEVMVNSRKSHGFKCSKI